MKLVNVRYSPAIARERSALLEVDLVVTNSAHASFYLEMEKSLLKYTEYSYDPNRGVDIRYSKVEQKSNNR